MRTKKLGDNKPCSLKLNSQSWWSLSVIQCNTIANVLIGNIICSWPHLFAYTCASCGGVSQYTKETSLSSKVMCTTNAAWWKYRHKVPCPYTMCTHSRIVHHYDRIVPVTLVGCRDEKSRQGRRASGRGGNEWGDMKKPIMVYSFHTRTCIHIFAYIHSIQTHKHIYTNR